MSVYIKGTSPKPGKGQAASKPESFTTGVRRIVTGNNDQLNGSIVEDTIIPFKELGYTGMSQACIWKTTEMPSNDTNLPNGFDGASRAGDRMEGYVCSMGTNFLIQDFAPGAEVPLHISHTVDYFLIVAGTMISITDSGEKFIANAGDVIVQRGDMHGWRNPGPQWARWAVVILDAKPAMRNGSSLTEGMKEHIE